MAINALQERRLYSIYDVNLFLSLNTEALHTRRAQKALWNETMERFSMGHFSKDSFHKLPIPEKILSPEKNKILLNLALLNVLKQMDYIPYEFMDIDDLIHHIDDIEALIYYLNDASTELFVANCRQRVTLSHDTDNETITLDSIDFPEFRCNIDSSDRNRLIVTYIRWPFDKIIPRRPKPTVETLPNNRYRLVIDSSNHLNFYLTD